MPLSPVAVTLFVFIGLMSALIGVYGLHLGIAVSRRALTPKNGDLE